jgi:hypothetical protein
MLDPAKVTDFMTTHARLLDRRRMDLALGDGDPNAALAALAAYRNRDGGFGSAIEPDLRAPTSQPVGALHAFEVFEDIAPHVSPLASGLCDWLERSSLPGGALPFALAGAAGPGTAPLWGSADPAAPSLHLTTVVAGIALRVARHDRAVAGHPWLQAATRYCLEQTAALAEAPSPIALRYILQFLDALCDTRPEVESELRRLAAFVPPSATMPVAGGSANEAMRPLDFSPQPGRPLRALIDPAVIEADLDRLEADQHADGGWDVDWTHWSPIGALEWRGWATVRAVLILRANGRLQPR